MTNGSMDASDHSGHQRQGGKVYVKATNITVVSLPRMGEPVVDIIFVHGLQGHPFSTWAAKLETPASTKKPNRIRRIFQAPPTSSATSDQHKPNAQDGFFWPRDALPNYCPQARILTWGYDSKVTRVGGTVNRNSLYDHARDLIYTLQRNLVSKRQIIFVTHSLGGIVVKDALSFSHTSNDSGIRAVVQNTAAIVFLGTPHRGSPRATLAESARKILSAVGMDTNHQILQALGLQTSELDRVQTSFSNIWNHYKFRVKTFQEALGFKPTSLLGMNEKVVDDVSSALGDARENAETLPANHMEMCRISDENDPNALNILGELHEIYKWVQNTWIPEHFPITPPHDLTHVSPPAQEPRHASNDQPTSREGINYLLTMSLESLQFPGIVANYGVNDYKFSSLAKIERLWSNHLSSKNNSREIRRLLWIKGSLGSGKSELMREAIRRHTTPDYHIAAFVCDTSANEDLMCSASGLFRSLLYQLLPLCFGRDEEPQDLIEILETKHNSTTPARAQIVWEPGELEKLLKTVVTQIPDRDILLFIDALDRCPENDRILIIGCLEKLSRKDDQNYSRVHIWVSSQDQVLLVPDDCLSIQMESINREDISDYVDEKLKLYPKRNLDELDNFKMQLKGRSSGNFLWVNIVVQIILERLSEAQYNIKSMESQLGELPRELNELYHTLLKEARKDRPFRLKFFQWAILNDDLILEHWQHILAFLDQQYPHSLSSCKLSRFWEEDCTKVGDQVSYLSLGLFRAALPLDEIEVSTDVDSMVSIDGAAGSMDSRMGNSRIVHPVHESVRTFFTQHHGFEDLAETGYPCTRSDGHITILHNCLDFISMKDFDSLIESRRQAYSTDQTRTYSSDDERSRRSFRSQSVASFSSASSGRGGRGGHGGWFPSWASSFSVDQDMPTKAGPQSQFPISPNNHERATDGKEVIDRRMTVNQWLQNVHAIYPSSRPSSYNGEFPEIPGQSTELQHPGALSFLARVISIFLDHCQSLDNYGYTPESVIYRLQIGGLWNRWLYLNEIDPSTTKLSDWAQFEQLHTWVHYLSTSGASMYEIMAKNPGGRRRPGEQRKYSISLRYCLDLGDRSIPYNAKDFDSDLTRESPDEIDSTISELPVKTDILSHLFGALDFDPVTELGFVPLQRLRLIVTPSTIRKVLESAEGTPITSKFVATIHRSCLRIFTTLIMIQKPKAIRKFLDKNINDDALPFKTDRPIRPRVDFNYVSLRNENPIVIAPHDLDFNMFDSNNFLHWQYKLLTPFLTQKGNDIYHYQIPYVGVALPITDASPWRSFGSEIEKVRFSSDSTSFTTSKSASEEWFLLHRVLSGKRSSEGNDWQKFLSKVYTWQYLKRDTRYSPNILEILCTIELARGGSPWYYFIYPYPDGDLWDLLHSDCRGFNLEWLKMQLVNMAKALASVHNVSRIGNSQLPSFKYLRRAHLQHDNFLWFGRPNQSPGHLVLSDLSEYKDRSLSAPESVNPANMAPRTVKGNFGKAAHIWSLGAIWLDVLAWFFLEPTVVNEFRDERGRGYYFENAEDSPTVVIPMVLALIEQLKSVENCPSFVDSLLDIIQYGMLVVIQRKRLSAEELVDTLELMLEMTRL